MNNFTLERIDELKNNFKGKRIAVVGDLMLDCYFWGEVKRISPEAPVPVVEIEDEFYRFGGAANVAYNLQTLGAAPFPLGVIGNDNDGVLFNKLIEDSGIDSSGIVVDENRPTTAKTRVIAGKQHVVRIDREKKNEIDKTVEEKILTNLKTHLDKIDGIILEDYNKGVLKQSLIKQIITLGNEAGKTITVDPKFNNFFDYENVTVFKPNRKETEDAFGIRIDTDEDIETAGKKLIEQLNPTYALLTLGEKGIALFDKENNKYRIPTKARKVLDVSGAGDTVISTLTLALCAGANITEAAYLANYAGGMVCEEVGVVPIELEKLFAEIEKDIKR